MSTEVSTRKRGPRPESPGRPAADGGRPAVRHPRAQPSGSRPAGASLASPTGTGARGAAGRAGTRPAGLAQPGVRSPAATPARREPGHGLPAAAPGGAHFPAARHVPRTRFILLVLGMLGGGLVCLLVINTTLAAASFRINALQRSNAALSQQEQTLQQQVSTEESPSSLEQRARRLGLRMQPLLNVMNLRTGRVYRQPASMPGIPNVPGYAP
jgi:hypothetical protein